MGGQMMTRVASAEREILAAALRVASKQYEIDAIALSLKNTVADTMMSQRRAAMVGMLRDLANRIGRATDLIIVEP
jgi:hypothetical protein